MECRNACVLLRLRLDEAKCTCCEIGHEDEEEPQCDRQARPEVHCFCSWSSAITSCSLVNFTRHAVSILSALRDQDACKRFDMPNRHTNHGIGPCFWLIWLLLCCAFRPLVASLSCSELLWMVMMRRRKENDREGGQGCHCCGCRQAFALCDGASLATCCTVTCYIAVKYCEGKFGGFRQPLLWPRVEPGGHGMCSSLVPWP